MSTETQDPVEQAVAAFQAGIDREESFRILVERHFQAVKGYLGKRIFSTEDCLDLTQEVFLSVYKGLDDFRGEARFRTWLFQIVHFTYLSWLRRRRLESRDDRQGFVQRGGTPPPAFEGPELAAVTPPTQTDALLRREMRQKLREAVGELPDQMRKCIQLRIYQDCSYQEIADFMGLSIETVKVHLHMARKRLKEMLREYHAEPTPERRGTQ